MAFDPTPLALTVGARLLGALPAPLRARLAGPPRTVDGQRVHPDVELVLRGLTLGGGETFETKPVAEGRAELRHEARAFGTRPRCAVVEDVVLAAPERDLPARRYRARRPTGAPAPAVILYLHGGGWVLGGPDAADSVCRILARRTGCEVVSLDYRLAPEHPFPAAVEDAVAAFRHLRDHPAPLHARAGRVVVAGESAGGNLACVVAQQTRHDAAGAPLLAAPVFPVTDLSRKTESYRTFSHGFFLTEAQMDWYRAHYLGPDPERVDERARDPRASPLLAPGKALHGLYPHHVVLAGLDPLRDEGRAYVARLREAGVDVECVEHAGFVHAFVDATVLGRTVTERVEALGDAILARVGVG